jgi:hypothetical protein
MSGVLNCLSDRGSLECRGIASSIHESLTERSGAAPAQRLAARWRAVWPAICAAIFALALIAFDHVQDKQEFGPSVTIHLMAFSAAFFGGWFLGVIGGMDWD